MYFALSSLDLHPFELLFGVCLTNDNKTISLPNTLLYDGEWGRVAFIENTEVDKIKHIHLVYYSITESLFYELDVDLDDKEQNGETLILGLAPNGVCHFWSRNPKEQKMIFSFNAKECSNKVHRFFKENEAIRSEWYGELKSDSDRSKKYLKTLNPQIQENLINEGLPSKDLCERLFNRFNYRYKIKLEKWNNNDNSWNPYRNVKEEAKFWFIEESLYDGTFNKLRGDNLLKFHKSAKPKKIRLKWDVYDFYYNCFIWFEEKELSKIFDEVYGINSDIHVDFIFHIDYSTNKYEISLNRYGLDCPIVIPENVYQIIVFKEMNQLYVSSNFNQKHNAWYW